MITVKYYELNDLIIQLRKLAEQTGNTDIHCLAVDIREGYDDLVRHYGLQTNKHGDLR